MMQRSLSEWLIRWNQWRFAPEFRIEPRSEHQWLREFEGMLGRAAQPAEPTAEQAGRPAPSGEATADQAPAPDAAPAKVTGSAAGGVPEQVDLDFVLTVCNSFFRLEANTRQLEQDGHESRQLRNLRFALRKLAELMEQYRIECVDLSGQSYDPGRNDVEIIGVAEEREGVTEMMIERCERPAVFWNGQIVQQARAIVVKPQRADSALN